jgi:outer membrane immunogenic protein
MIHRFAGAAAIALCVGPVTSAVAQSRMDWSGAYIGLNAGYGWSGSDVNVSGSPPANFAAAFAVGQILARQSLDPSGFIGGGQAGYNLQSGQVVYGVEVDFSGADINGSDTANFAEIPGIAFGSITTARQSIDWLTTLRGRLGFAALDSWLFYATAGLAVGQTQADYESVLVGPSAFIRGSTDGVRTGYVVGGGTEHALNDHVTVRFEYLYFDLGSATVNAPQFGLGVAGTVSLIGKYEFEGNIVRGALNYRF